MAQGPILIFDKSSLESLNLDEAVLLDTGVARERPGGDGGLEVVVAAADLRAGPRDRGLDALLDFLGGGHP